VPSGCVHRPSHGPRNRSQDGFTSGAASVYVRRRTGVAWSPGCALIRTSTGELHVATAAVVENDYIVREIAQADYGRAEIAIAETGRPGLRALREEYGAAQPLKGARITGSLHMTIQTAVLMETLVALGAELRWATCNIFSTQDHAAAAMAARGIPTFAVKGESLADYWDYVGRIFDWGDETTCNMILDDGGDATMFALWGARVEAGEKLFEPSNAEEVEFCRALNAFLKAKPGYLTKTVRAIH